MSGDQVSPARQNLTSSQLNGRAPGDPRWFPQGGVSPPPPLKGVAPLPHLETLVQQLGSDGRNPHIWVQTLNDATHRGQLLGFW